MASVCLLPLLSFAAPAPAGAAVASAANVLARAPLAFEEEWNASHHFSRKMTMAYLRVELDEEGLEGPDDLLGDIKLGSREHSLDVSTVYVDSWLVAFIEGAEGLKGRPDIEVEMFEEPTHLIFRLSQTGLSVVYGNQRVQLPSLSEFAAALARAAAEFISRLRALDIPLASENLQVIDRYSTNFR